MKYVLPISRKSIITTFMSGMHIFWGNYWNFSLFIKVVFSCGIAFKKCMYIPIRFWIERKRNLTSKCYINISLEDMFDNIIHDSSKRWRRLFQLAFFKFILYHHNSQSDQLLDSLVFLSVRSFHNINSDCSIKSSHSLSD